MPPPMITTSPGGTPGTPARSVPRPPRVFCRKLAPTTTDIRPATSDIGVEQRQPALAVLDRLVGDAGDLALQQRVGELGQRRQVEVGEEELAALHQVRTRRATGSLTLTIISGLLQTLSASGTSRAPDAGVLGVGDAAAHPRPLLHEDLVARLARGRGRRPGSSPTLYSWSLTSLGIPMRTSVAASRSGSPAGAEPRVGVSSALAVHLDLSFEEGPLRDAMRGAAMFPSRLPVAATSTRSAARYVADHPAADAHHPRLDRAPATTPSAPTTTTASTRISPSTRPSISSSVAPVIAPWTTRAGSDGGRPAAHGRLRPLRGGCCFGMLPAKDRHRSLTLDALSG